MASQELRFRVAEIVLVVFRDFQLGLEMHAEDSQPLPGRRLHGDVDESTGAMERHPVHPQGHLIEGMLLHEGEPAQ